MDLNPNDPMSRIIWSADVSDEGTLRQNLAQMTGLRIIKIDRLFVETIGDLAIIRRLQEELGVAVFDDAKFFEIGDKLEKLVREHLRYRPWMVNCMAGNVSSRVQDHDDRNKVDALKRFADACHEAGTRPCGVTVLTNKHPEIAAQEFRRTPTDQVLYYLEVLLEAGFTDVVCSPLEAPAIRAESRFNTLDLNTPGVRPAGSSKDDQARTNTVENALGAGATRLIIGRPLTIGNPSENLVNIAASVRAAIGPSITSQLQGA